MLASVERRLPLYVPHANLDDITFESSNKFTPVTSKESGSPLSIRVSTQISPDLQNLTRLVSSLEHAETTSLVNLGRNQQGNEEQMRSMSYDNL